MKRKNKIRLGIIATVFAFISTLIGLWLLSDVGETYSFAVRLLLRFFLMVTPIFVLQAVFNLLKEDQ